MKFIKDTKVKVQASIQGDIVRVSGPRPRHASGHHRQTEGQRFRHSHAVYELPFELRFRSEHDYCQATPSPSTKKHGYQPVASSALIANELHQVELEFERQARSNVQVIAYLGEYSARFRRQTRAPGAHDSFELCCRRRRLALQLDSHGHGDGVSAHRDAGPRRHHRSMPTRGVTGRPSMRFTAMRLRC